MQREKEKETKETKEAKETAKMRGIVTILKQIIFVFIFLSLAMPANVTAVSISGVNHTSDTLPSSPSTFGIAGVPQNLLHNQKQKMGKPYELVLFYNASCKHCFQFCRTLKDYALQNRMSVIAFKLTEQYSPYFPDSVLVDRRTIEQYFGKDAQIAVPSLFILNPSNMHLYPVSRGDLTSYELRTRIDELMKKIRIFEGRSHA